MLAKWLERRSADQLAVLMAGRKASRKAETSVNSLGKKWADWKVKIASRGRETLKWIHNMVNTKRGRWMPTCKELKRYKE